MRKIAIGEDIPADFHYFRSKSNTYRSYLTKGGLRTIDLHDQFGWLKDFKLFQIAKFERTTAEPTRELLQAHGFKHGLLLWIPGHSSNPGKLWKNLWIPGSHFVSTGIANLYPNYFKSWNERAQRARKKFLSNGTCRIESVDEEEFVRCFKLVSVKHSFKKEYINYYRSMYSHGPESIRSYVAYDAAGKPIAGLAVHDFENTSVHLVAFTGKEAKPVQAGTGLVDRWYADSLEKGLSYIHFDHLRDSNMTRDQQGYTDFKMNFIETSIRYPKCFFQIW